MIQIDQETIEMVISSDFLVYVSFDSKDFDIVRANRQEFVRQRQVSQERYRNPGRDTDRVTTFLASCSKIALGLRISTSAERFCGKPEHRATSSNSPTKSLPFKKR